MYLRTTSRTNRDGSRVEYYQLAHNAWDADKRRSRAIIVHNFGRADQLDRGVLVRLCESIARVVGLEVRDPLATGEAPRRADEDILRDGIEQRLTRPLGVTLVIESLWERLGIGPCLRALAKKKGKPVAYERALLAMTANRLCDPDSKLGLWEYWLPTVHLPTCWDLPLRRMYEAMDFLHQHAAEVEEAVFFQTAGLLNLQVDLVFFDTTTASFSIDDPDDEEDDGSPGLRQLGHSKEGTWTPQVVIALAVTRDGLPVKSWVLPGNTSDATLVKRIRDDLRGWKLHRALFVSDSGFNSEDNREELARACGRYVLACRAGSVAEVKHEVLGRQGRYKEVTDNLRVKEVVVGEGERRRRYIVCHNPKQAAREAAHRGQVVAELEDELARHADLKATAKWATELRASKRYGRYLALTRGGRLRIDRKAVRGAARLDGRWVLLTNDDSLSVEDAALAYKGLLVIERCFRTMKRTQIQLTPMYHWLPRRIEAHVKICVLALLIERVATRETRQSWRRTRQALMAVQATEYRSDSFRFFRRNELEPGAKELLANLAIPVPKPILGVEPLPGTLATS